MNTDAKIATMSRAVDVAAIVTPSLPAQTMIRGVSINADLGGGPYLIDGADTIVKLLLKRCTAYGDRIAHREKHLGIWRAYSWRDYLDHARLIGLGLMALGLKRGDVVSILSEDRKEWLYADAAIQCVGGISSGVYVTDSASQLAYLVADSGSRFLFVENDEQLDKYIAVRDQMPSLVKAIVFDREGLHGFEDDDVIFLDDLYDLGRAHLAAYPDLFETEIGKSRPGDTALLIYTSGTSGPPKGAALTHENVMFTLSSGMHCLVSLPSDEQLCFLPLCHVLERLISMQTPIVTGATVNFAESAETVFDNVREVSPHLFVAVPRVWEKIYSRISIMVGEATALGRFAYRAALKTGMRRADCLLEGRTVPMGLKISYAFWDLVVLSNLRRMIGMSQIRRANSGAAPISPDLLRWYWGIGIPVYEGYGQTEGSGLTSVNTPQRMRNGTVGPAIDGLNVRIAPDGEIQMKGPNVFHGYWQKPARTAEAMTADGWLRTGDVGRIDADGFIIITGRLKDIIITAGGKNITPSEIENRLKFSPYISDAVVIGDRKPYLTCLIMIDQENVEKFAQDHRIPFNDFASLCAAPAVKDLIHAVVEEANSHFARVEQVKDFRIIDVLLTVEDDELTATMKLKRSFVEKKYKTLIDEMYAGNAA